MIRRAVGPFRLFACLALTSCRTPAVRTLACVGLPSGFRATTDAETDRVTGLPTRIEHEATGITLALIPAGTFLMGSPPQESGHSDNERQHHRVIRQPYYMSRTETTTAQFAVFARDTGYLTEPERGVPEQGHGRGAFAATEDGNRAWNEDASWRNPFPNLIGFVRREDHAAVHLTWTDAQAFCSHFGFALPTEAQWEYACRAGTTTPFFWGNGAGDCEGSVNVCDHATARRFPSSNIVFPFNDGEEVIAPVGRYRPNDWGLYDMVGNVQEWCRDAYGTYPQHGAEESAMEPDPVEAGPTRVVRGSAWLDGPGNSRSAHRFGMQPVSRRDFIGFRVVLRIPQ